MKTLKQIVEMCNAQLKGDENFSYFNAPIFTF